MKVIQAMQTLGERDFKVIKNAAYGAVDGYPVVVTANQGSARLLLVNVTLQTRLEKDDIKLLRRALKAESIKAAVEGRVLSWPLKVSRNVEAEEMLSNIRTAIGILKEHRIKPPCACGVCGRGGADTYVMTGAGGQQLYDTVHRTCMDKLQMDMESKVAENPGSYLTGLLGALLGAICGALPALLVLAFLNTISLWLFAFIPLGANLGYRQLKGKMDLAAPILSCLMSFVGLGFLLVGYDVVTNVQYWGIPLKEAAIITFENTFQSFSVEYWKYILPNLGTILLFFALGLIFSFTLLRRTNKVELKDLQSLKGTAQPIRQEADPAAPSENPCEI